MVGRPCGQLHGFSRLAILFSTLFISFLLNAVPVMSAYAGLDRDRFRARVESEQVPIMMAERHAREANMADTRDSRHIAPGCSSS